MLLAMDIGNTSILVGVYKGEKLLNYWHLATIQKKTSDEYGIYLKQLLLASGISQGDIKNAIISSVVPPLTGKMQKTFQRYFNINPLVVGPGIKTGISIKFDYPKEVGADRIVNAVAAFHSYGKEKNTPLIIVDFGTATTFCVLSKKGEYLGGVIAPGITISSEALFKGASKLPRVELEKPLSVVGKNTVESMQAGIYYGFVGLIKEIIKRINEEMKIKHKVIATGEIAELIAEEVKEIDCIDSLLTLKGLKIIFEKNML